MIPRLLFDQNVLNQCLQQPTFWYRLGDSLIDKGILTSMSGGADFIPTLTYSGVVEFLGLPKKIEKAMKDAVPPIKTWREVESVATHLERCRDAYARLPLLQPASLQTELQQKREHCVARAENGWHDVQPLLAARTGQPHRNEP